jgi:hypothetical protein
MGASAFFVIQSEAKKPKQRTSGAKDQQIPHASE